VVPDAIVVCAYPRTDGALRRLRDRGVSLLINLDKAPHDPAQLERHGLLEMHLPVPDRAPPSLDQLDVAIQSMSEVISAGHRVAIHCSSGLGRSGTLAACYLVHLGATPREAMERIRSIRFGSIPEPSQVRTLVRYGRRMQGQNPARIRG
jgi:atypical dual specificity phosphatase